MNKLFAFVLIVSFSFAHAQVGINTANPTAELEIVTTNSSAGTKAFSIVNSTGTVLLTVANNGEIRVNSLAAGGQVIADTSGKLQIGTTSPIRGDIKSCLITVDHQGWIKLDGRAVAVFTPTQKAQLNALGFFTNIPNASSAVLMQSNQPLGSVSGSMQKNITQGNLPNINFPTATTSTTGNHTHGHNAPATPGNFGLIRRSSGGANTAQNTDGGGSGDEPNIVATPGALVINNAGNHNHTVTVSSGGSNTPMDVTPRNLSVNVFLYVGL